MSYSVAQALSWSPFTERLTQKFPDLLNEESYCEQWPQGELYQRVYSDVIQAVDDKELAKKLRIQRNWQMGRIALRDLMGFSELEEVMLATSELADALVNSALDWHYERFCVRYGTPMGMESNTAQKMIVIGMGKLGGKELNFSSDIDLIFAYPEHGATQGASRSIPNEQFFIRLGQALNKSLVDYTEDGFVYRVDMRLRPFGDSGPLAVSFAGLEHYYELHGRAWERYALVKARAMAGDKDESKYMFDILRPFVYRRYVDFSAMESLRELKQMIMVEVQKKGMLQNVKLGPGGIREVEFIVQAFQLVHGGRDHGLQGRRLIPMLAHLLERGFIQKKEHDALLEAYVFLRRAENRLQEWNDQQTHDLPSDEHQQVCLAESMGFENYATFKEKLDAHRDFVSAQFNEVFAVEAVSTEVNHWRKIWLSGIESEEDLAEFDLEDPGAFVRHIKGFKQSRSVGRLGAEGIERLNAFMPLLLNELFQQGYSEEMLIRALKIVENVVQRSVYLVLLNENPQALKNLVALVEVSPWLTDMLAKYPALMDQLIDERSLYAPLELNSLNAEVANVLQGCEGDEECFMEQIRQWRHAQVFKVAAADVTGNVPVMKVSDYLTWIAEAVLNGVVEFAWQLMLQKSGVPGGLDPDNIRNPFLVLGYGKVGGIELGYGSDLDIVLLYEGLSPSDSATNERGRQLENSLFFVRMGQKIISLMTTLMPAGILYEVDTRLRPNGASGMIVTDFESYKAYIENKAWNWEHQALTRVRAVVGDEQSRSAFETFKSQYLQRPREIEVVKQEVVAMRDKMREALDKSNAEQFDLKQGVGGIVDIEFMVQYLVLAYANVHPSLTEYSDNVRILEAIERVGLLTDEQVEPLIGSYKVYRSKYHRVALQNEKPIVEQSCYVKEREAVKGVWNCLMA